MYMVSLFSINIYNYDKIIIKPSNMKHLNLYESFIYNEKFKIGLNDILKSIEAVEINPVLKLKINVLDFKSLKNLQDLKNSNKIKNILKEINIKISKIYKIDKNSTFIDSSFKYCTLNSNEKDGIPLYLILEKDNILKFYSIEGDFNDFYNKLSTKKIAINKNGNEYIYQTTNYGKNWYILNPSKNISDKLSDKELEKEKYKILD